MTSRILKFQDLTLNVKSWNFNILLVKSWNFKNLIACLQTSPAPLPQKKIGRDVCESLEFDTLKCWNFNIFRKFKDLTCRILKFEDSASKILKFQYSACQFLKLQNLTSIILKFHDLRCRILKFADCACKILKFQDSACQGRVQALMVFFLFFDSTLLFSCYCLWSNTLGFRLRWNFFAFRLQASLSILVPLV